jgi:exonuclease VII small subunit
MTTEPTDGGSTPVSELSFTEASRELDAIVGFFEQREVDVDQLVLRLERASAIVDELDRRVRKTRAQVEELVPRLEAVNRDLVEPDTEDDDGAGGIGDAPAGGIGDAVGSADDGNGDEPALF